MAKLLDGNIFLKTFLNSERVPFGDGYPGVANTMSVVHRPRVVLVHGLHKPMHGKYVYKLYVHKKMQMTDILDDLTHKKSGQISQKRGHGQLGFWAYLY